MPENWKTYKLEEISRNVSRRFDFSKGSEVVFINTGDVLEGKFLHSDLRSSEKLPGQAKKAIKKGDILFSEIRPKNKRYAYVDFSSENYVVSTKFMVIETEDFLVDRRFFLQLLTSNERLNELQTIAEGRSGTFPQITFDAIGDIEFHLPPLQEQKSIASILSALDDKIELNLQMNKTLEEMAMALYKHWFVNFGPFQDGEFVDSELGEIPKGWELVELKEVCRVINGRAYKNEEFLNEGTPIIRIQNLKGAGKTVYSNLELPENKYVDSGDLIYAWSATFGPYIWAGPKSIYHYHIWKLEVDSSKMSKFYMFHHLDRISTQLKEHGTGSIFTHLTKGSMEKQKMILPKQEIISDFHKKISPYHKLILRNKDQNQTLTQIRNTLLPKLISGEVRVKDVEKTLSAVL
ncbi:restriction endonuclease subunit S [Salegentibacter sp. F188]|uniref:Restriction endonuclease subunit S n=1 Tax=Autumnicola patrickiae TaxID=3075591 RepID=A0ABU3E2Z3_9FLAO|nr:restriction endonuclease subunit S [Salegentibacter sp. F188]MDT0690300.1 restriction endonuclease subunit S [Salegentibacter sp. F188]